LYLVTEKSLSECQPFCAGSVRGPVEVQENVAGRGHVSPLVVSELVASELVVLELVASELVEPGAEVSSSCDVVAAELWLLVEVLLELELEVVEVAAVVVEGAELAGALLEDEDVAPVEPGGLVDEVLVEFEVLFDDDDPPVIVDSSELLLTGGVNESASPHAAASNARRGTMETICGEQLSELREVSERRVMTTTLSRRNPSSAKETSSGRSPKRVEAVKLQNRVSGGVGQTRSELSRPQKRDCASKRQTFPEAGGRQLTA
jgi:hypothetical protein